MMIFLKRTALALTVFINVSPMMATNPAELKDQCRQRIQNARVQFDSTMRVTTASSNEKIDRMLQPMMYAMAHEDDLNPKDRLELRKSISLRNLQDSQALIAEFEATASHARAALDVIAAEQTIAQTCGLERLFLEARNHINRQLAELQTRLPGFTEFLEKAKVAQQYAAEEERDMMFAAETERRLSLADETATAHARLEAVWYALKRVRHCTAAVPHATATAAAADAHLETVRADAALDAPREAAITVPTRRGLLEIVWSPVKTISSFVTGTAPALETAPVACRAATARTAVLAATEARLAKAAAEKAAQAKLAAEAHLVATIAVARRGASR